MTEEKPKRMVDVLQDAYVAGWRQGVEAYAVWKDGRQLVGSGRYSLSDAQKSAAEDAAPFFASWLQRQKAAFGRPEEDPDDA